jgi:5-methyltetrahydrofolate--homocysteine methyltransferase
VGEGRLARGRRGPVAGLARPARAVHGPPIDADYADIRQRHRNRGDAKRLVSLEKARGQRFDGGWADYDPPAPNMPGLHVFSDYPLDDLVDVIDWTPFFQAWELAGKYPAILTDPVVGKQASELYRDARAMLDTIIRERWLTAKAVFGLWPANSVGDDVVVTCRWPARHPALPAPAGRQAGRAPGLLPGRLHRAARTAASATGSARSR